MAKKKSEPGDDDFKLTVYMGEIKLCRRFHFGFLLFIMPACGFCQAPVKAFIPGMYSRDEYAALKLLTGNHKKIPPGYEKQILVALSYFPELINISIDFRFKHTNTSFSTRPAILSVFKRSSRRKYIITISDSCKAISIPLLFKNLPYNAQIGVMSHELTHASDFIGKNFFGLIRVALGNLSNKFLDRFERKTDSLCITHGPGYVALWQEVFSVLLQSQREKNQRTLSRRHHSQSIQGTPVWSFQ